MSGGWDIEGTLWRLHYAWLEPLLFAARKRRRLGLFDLQRLAEVPCVDIDWMPSTPHCTSACAALFATERRYFARYGFGDEPGGSLWRGTPCVIELDRYPDIASYAGCLRGHSKGANLRQIRRARDAGFFCRPIFPDFYSRERFAIETSKGFRSGPVPAALLRRPPAADFGGGLTAADIASYLGRPLGEITPGLPLPRPPPSSCPHHWSTDWGVFATTREAEQASAKEWLVGYLGLRRIGSVVRIAGLMGHGDYLRRGVMKLLLHDVIAWLLAREEPQVQGLRFLQYGAVEHGNRGLLAWKQRFGFVPFRYRSAP